MSSSIHEQDGLEMASRLAPLKHALDGASVLVTGATGFVGTWVLEALSWCRHQFDIDITAVVPVRDVSKFSTRLPHFAEAQWIRTRQGDVRTVDLSDTQIDLVMHAASTVTPAALRADPAGTQSIVIDGTRRVIEQAARSGAKRVLLMSSGSVYGAQRNGPVPILETSGVYTDPFAAGRVLPEAKRAAEAIASSLSSTLGVDMVVARGFAMSGPWLPLDADFALGNFIAEAINGREIRPRGDGMAIRSYLYGADVAVWALTLLLRGDNQCAYNMGGSTPYRIRDVARLVAERAGVRAEVPHVPMTIGGSLDYFVPDITRAAALGLAEWTPLSTAIDRMLGWYPLTSSRSSLSNV